MTKTSTTSDTTIFDLVLLFGHACLLSMQKINPSTVPAGMRLYSLQHDGYDLSTPTRISEADTTEDFFGSLIVPGYIRPARNRRPGEYRVLHEEDLQYEGCTLTLEEYVEELYW